MKHNNNRVSFDSKSPLTHFITMHLSTIFRAVFVLFFTGVAGLVSATSYYTSPTGTATASGSISDQSEGRFCSPHQGRRQDGPGLEAAGGPETGPRGLRAARPPGSAGFPSHRPQAQLDQRARPEPPGCRKLGHRDRPAVLRRHDRSNT